MKKALVIGMLMSTGIAHASPTAVFTGKDFSFVEFLSTDLVKSVEAGLVDTDYTLFWFAEKQNVVTPDFSGPVSSFYVFFDPDQSQRVNATVTFDSTILAVYSSHGDRLASLPTYGIGEVDYLADPYDGLEPHDTLSFSGNTLSLNWQATDPGDHVRVILAAVPEPLSSSMLLAGLGILGMTARRRMRG